ncbi:hypothetical protein [Streptomyces sp. NPDC014995]|uniref:hypothetical protein n=1 Tax=Streptomyces sp. NPDC014995 TaxID=3364936 RepID=UPI003701F058
MSESVPVRCPACRRERLYTAPSYPCVCGSAVAPRLDPRTAPTAVAHRAWEEEWVTVPCPACGHRAQWPRPELGCPCGTVLRIPVTMTGPRTESSPEEDADTGQAAGSGRESGPAQESGTGQEVDAGQEPDTAQEPSPPQEPGTGQESASRLDAVPGQEAPTTPPQTTPSSSPRRPFHPVAIRTARDAVTATALYLRWLGYRDIRRADQRPASGIGLAARGLLAHVDPSVHPASLRDVECLWLTAMSESAHCAYFSLAGYAPDARARADSLAVPLFVLDLAGTPQPVNAAAEELEARSA